MMRPHTLFLAIALLMLPVSKATCQNNNHDVYVKISVSEGDYYAAITRKGWKSPIDVKLGNGIDELRIDSWTYSQEGSSPVYESIIEPISKHLKKGDTIYYTVAGRIHFINLDALFAPDGHRLFEKYNLRRVSSLESIPAVEKKGKYYRPTPIIYGGMDYEASYSAMNQHAEWVHTKKLQKYVNDCPGWDLSEITFGRAEDGTRAGFSYLRFSREEVKYINNLMHRASVHSGAESMEELFRFDTRRTEDYMVHLSTHSFYVASYSPESAEGLTSEQIEKRRYGLLFSGAGHTFAGEKMPFNLNDGLLYGEEIESLDMRHCDLLVLSACSTALGRVTQEGIDGLQGSFKKAGAKTLLMTLWCVHDEATSMFMKNFYGYLSKGYPKAECLSLARRDMIQSEYFNDPAYWAAFIMLD